MMLDAKQVRVLGALMEKEMTTPEGYPLSLNSLVLACNQRSSRDPVMELTEEEVRQALHALDDLGMTSTVRDSRVAKYEHRIRTVLNLRRDETAVLCLLFLRGPQTPGELRSRSERLHSFDDLEAVQSTLERMAGRPSAEDSGDAGASGPLAVMLARQAGSRESRWAHLLSGPVAGRAAESPVVSGEAEVPPSAGLRGSLAQRVQALEDEVATLRAEVAALRDRFQA